MQNKICDLHSDTLYEVRKNKTSLINHRGHLSFEKLSAYDSFIQVFAMWSDKKLSPDEAYDAFLDGAELLKRELSAAENAGHKVRLALTGEDITQNEKDNYSTAIFAVEGGALLSDKLSRLEILYNKGVRIMTLVWAGECELGGAHDNDTGFTPFGREVIKLSFELGIIPDLSHANRRQTDEALELAAKYSRPVIATHSNSYAVYPHSRNLTDEHYKEIIKSGGIVGVSTADIHLGDEPTIDTVAEHIEHYLSLYDRGVCLGCDFDGADPPRGIADVRDIKKLGNILASRGLAPGRVENIMYNNARDFLVQNLGRS